MEQIVQWATILAPIIGPISAVLIAWWTIKSSAKDTAKQIATLEVSTKEQVECIEELAKIQIELALDQIDKEIWEGRYKQHQINKEISDNLERTYRGSQYGSDWKKLQAENDATKALEYRHEFYEKMNDRFEFYRSRIERLRTKKES